MFFLLQSLGMYCIYRAILSLFFMGALSLFANPKEGFVVSGQAIIQPSDPNTLVITTQGRSIIEWHSFSIQPHEATRFVMPSANAVVLNRVMGEEASRILGSLSADGKIYLINPNGILFGADAAIDVGSLIATTFPIPDGQFLAGGNLLLQGDEMASVINLGRIAARHGDVALIAHRVENYGRIESPKGSAVLAAGHELLLQPANETLVYIRPDSSPADGVVNEGVIEALQAELQVVSHPHALGIRQDGTVKAARLVEEGGRILLKITHGKFDNGQEGKLIAANGSIELAMEDSLALNNGLIQAESGTINIMDDPDRSFGNYPFYNEGVMDVSGTEAGTISIDVIKFSNHGSLLADGGKEGGAIDILATAGYIETANGRLSIKGESKGGTASIRCGGAYFSSGSIELTGDAAGELNISAQPISLIGTQIKANGKSQGGAVHFESNFTESKLNLSPFTDINVSVESGREGNIFIQDIAQESSEIFGGAIQGESAQPALFFRNKSNAKLPNLFDYLKNLTDSCEESCSCAPSSFASFLASGAVLSGDMVLDAPPSTCVCMSMEFVDPNPTGANSSFGQVVQPLSTGNVVITKPSDDFGANTNNGAVYLYSGATAALISAIRGSTNNDQIGNFGIQVLNNGNFLIKSPNWNNGAATNAGAATFANGTTGVSGIVSSTNSLIGTTTNDQVGGGVGSAALTPLNHYVVISSSWNNGAATTAGAVTWGDGTIGITGAVTTANSLVGSTTGDQVGSSGVAVLSNGNYVVRSPNWDNGAATNAGAATWVDGTNGRPSGSATPGASVTSANSLVGSSSNDNVSFGSVTALLNGNYVVASPFWNGGFATGFGAVTWGDGTTGISGTVSALNSITGALASDFIGSGGVRVVGAAGGNYVISSPAWTGGFANGRGAATWRDGTLATSGTVTAGNSMTGTTIGDRVSSSGIVALTNGNYVIASPAWKNGGSSSGAATWGDGAIGTTGTVGTGNSITGASASADQVSFNGITALSNGNFVVRSSLWRTGGIPVGAATLGNGANGTMVVTSAFGVVTALNSLVGNASGDAVSGGGAAALTNGNYVVASPDWDNGGAANAGAATWVDGTTGVPFGAVISSTNSLVGTTAGDQVGTLVLALLNNNYIVTSPNWDNPIGPVANVGAATWGDGNTGISGTISASNSLIGSTINDQIAINSGVTNLGASYYSIQSVNWDNGAFADAGAITLGDAATGTYCGATGAVTTTNSFVGENSSTGLSGTAILDSVNNNFLFKFTNFNGQARVFAATLGPCTAPPPSPPAPPPFSPDLRFALHASAAAIAEMLQDWTDTSIGGYLSYDQFSPMATAKDLIILFPSLVNFSNWDRPLTQEAQRRRP